MNSLFPDICTRDVKACVDFYTTLFAFRPVFQADWYAQLVSADNPSVQIAFVAQHHDSVPAAHCVKPKGGFVNP